MKICFKFASRQRPDKFLSCMENITNTAKGYYFVLGTFDEDDLTMNNPIMIEKLSKYPKLVYVFGKSTGKINAINRDMNDYLDWDILINMSDDMFFKDDGFDLRVIQDMKLHFPDTDGVLHYPDGYTRDQLMTLSIIGKKYYERDNYIYHEDYKSLWCDNEATTVAKKRERYRFIDHQFYIHRHPANGYGVQDSLLRKTEAYFQEDKKTFMARQRDGFPKHSIYA